MRKNLLILLFLITLVCPVDGSEVTNELHRLAGIDNYELISRGYEFLEQCKYDSALIYYSAVVNRPVDESDVNDATERITAYGNIGLMYMTYFYDYRKAYANFLEAKYLAEKYDLKEYAGTVYLNIANVIYYDNLSVSSTPIDFIPYLQKAFDCAYEARSLKLLIASMSNLIECCIENQNIECLGNRLAKFRQIEIGDSILLKEYITLKCEAMEAYMCRDFDTSASLFILSSQNVQVNINPKQYMICALTCAADIYAQTGQWVKAEDVLAQALELSEDPLTRFYALSLNLKLAKVYGQMGDSSNEQAYNYRYLTLKDSLISKSQIGNAKDAQFEFDINKANEEIQKLNESRKLQTMLLLIAVAVVCVFAVMLFLLFRLYRRIREHQKQLYQTNLEILERERQLRLQHESPQRKYQNSRLTENDTKDLYNRILSILENSSEIYNIGFNIDRLSELVHSRTRYVSQAINEHANANFNALLNKYRIMEACRLLNDGDNYGNYTVEAIAEMVGFKSRTSFSTLFKTVTGLTPSLYKSIANEQKK